MHARIFYSNRRQGLIVNEDYRVIPLAYRDSWFGHVASAAEAGNSFLAQQKMNEVFLPTKPVERDSCIRVHGNSAHPAFFLLRFGHSERLIF
ncbi:MAG: hypothetical protein HY567_01515 [Candidatus Kerfeldbacteria bacterium]|nr:hypothetical protein [Candidatus Kerfeldbacteria bacterium]